MNAAGMLVPHPPTTEDTRSEQQRQLWEVTRERMEKFLPGLLESVVPAPEPESQPVPQTQTQPGTEPQSAQSSGEVEA